MLNDKDEVLNLIFKISDKLEYEVDKNGIVTMLIKQDHKIQRVFRKLGFKIPEYKKLQWMSMEAASFFKLTAAGPLGKLERALKIRMVTR